MVENKCDYEGVMDGELLYACLNEILDMNLVKIEQQIKSVAGCDVIDTIGNYMSDIVGLDRRDYNCCPVYATLYGMSFGESLNFFYGSHNRYYHEQKRTREDEDLFKAFTVYSIFNKLSASGYVPAQILMDANVETFIDIIRAKTKSANPYNNVYKKLSKEYITDSIKGKKLGNVLFALKDKTFCRWTPLSNPELIRQRGLNVGEAFVDLFKWGMLLIVKEDPDNIYARYMDPKAHELLDFDNPEYDEDVFEEWWEYDSTDE